MPTVNSNIITEVANSGPGGTAIAAAFNDINDALENGVFDTITSPVFRTSTSGPRLEFTNNSGIAATMYFIGDAQNSLSMAAAENSVAINVTSETGQFNWLLTPNLADACSITDGGGNDILVFSTTTGQLGMQHKGTRLGFYSASPVAQAAHIADPSGGGTQDAQARTAINAILVVLENLGLTATS